MKLIGWAGRPKPGLHDGFCVAILKNSAMQNIDINCGTNYNEKMKN